MIDGEFPADLYDPKWGLTKCASQDEARHAAETKKTLQMATILGKRFGELSVEDVQQLVAEKRHEDRHIEYKRQLPSKDPAEAVSKFVESVASFANTEGGVMLYGVKEEDHVPTEIVGLKDVTEDVENRRLESYARERIDPAVTNIVPHWHPWKDGKKLLVLEIPRSLVAPHGVEGRFYGRQTGAKYAMPTHEVRQLFLERDYWEREAEEFRRARVSGALRDDFGLLIPVPPGPVLLVHVLPLGRTRQNDVDAERTDHNWDERRATALALIHQDGWSRRYNLHGWVYSFAAPEGGTVQAFLQFFRSGAVESYRSLQPLTEEGSLIIGGALERYIVVSVQGALEWLKKCRKEPPFVVYVTLCALRNFKIVKEYPPGSGGAGFQQGDNYLPGLFIEQPPSTRRELALVLKPIIDTVWQAAGSSKSPWYERGEWHEQE